MASRLISKVKKIISDDLVKVFSLNAISTFVRMLTGFVSVKIVAVVIGPVGIALLGQLNNFTSILLSISTGGINAGVTKYIARYSQSKKRYSLFLSTSLWITLVLSILCGIVLVIGSSFFSSRILKTDEYAPVFMIFGVTLILYAFNAVLVATINGFKEFKKYTIVNISGSVVGLLFSIVLVYSFGIYGALIASVTYQSIVFGVTLLLVLKSPWFDRKIFFSKFSKFSAIRLSHYSLMALVSALVVPLSQLLVRDYINVSTGSMADAGLWEGMSRISVMYLMVLTTSLSIYFLPKLSQLKTDAEIRHEIFHVYKLIVPFLLVFFLSIFAFRHVIINILFDKKFSGMENLFAFQLMGDFFKIVSWILAYQLIARAMTKTFIITEVVSSLAFVLISTVFINKYGNVGATIGYAVNYFLYLVLMVFIFRKMLFKLK